MSEEKKIRREPRVGKLNLVSVGQFDEKGFWAGLTLGRTLNISRHGIEIELDQPLPLRSIVTFSLVLGPDEIADLKGTVRHLEAIDDERCRMGIQFLDTSPEIQKLLDEFLDRAEEWRQRVEGA